jgi:hypothetical protein
MMERLLGGLGEAANAQLRLVAIALTAVFAGAAGLALAAGAVFIAAMDRYGARDACILVAVLCFALAALLVVVYAVMRRRCAAAARLRKAQSRSLLADPMVLRSGLQLANVLGTKRALLLFGALGAALAFVARRPEGPQTDLRPR